jgi:hypothetical protein
MLLGSMFGWNLLPCHDEEERNSFAPLIQFVNLIETFSLWLGLTQAFDHKT